MTPDAAAETAALITSLWQRQLPTMHERLDVLDRIAATAAGGAIHEEDRELGISIAHKFAGSLGMYGFKQGSEVASELEQFLRSSAPFDAGLLLSLTHRLREAVFPANP